MKGDFSRATFDPEKHYTQVLMQQGRLMMDADWNEQGEILQDVLRSSLADIIGPCGAPASEAGFEIGIRKRRGTIDLTISPGRMYVRGNLCRLNEKTTYLKQPHFPNPSPLPSSTGDRFLVFLDVWQRHITYIEDPALLESALGGPDTTTRSKTIWQVRALPIRGSDKRSGDHRAIPPRPGDARLTTECPQYLGSENRLYRIEIHEGGNAGEATFKWSRENGSITAPIKRHIRNRRDKVAFGETHRFRLGSFQIGDTVEVSDDSADLSGTGGSLARVLEVDESAGTMVFDRPVEFDKSLHPKVRKWDIPDPKGIAANAGNAVALEHGIQITFEGSDFRVGDYWTFSARVNSGTVESLLRRPPQGMEHSYCPLAIVELRKGRRESRSNRLPGKPLVRDLRRIFHPASVAAAQHPHPEYGDPQVPWPIDVVDPRTSWSDIVLPRDTLKVLKEVAARTAGLRTVLEDWGFEKHRFSRGIVALFTGPPGTGKTMAAEILANELRLPLFRVDLRGVISKYIGETEKNLAGILRAAEESGAVLLFDEADALFGKRSEVGESHDQFANLETNFLMARIERYRGLVVVTTNLEEDFDVSFLRRMDFVVEFPFPTARARRRIWRTVFPQDTPFGEVNLDEVGRLRMTGGDIRNIALNAAILAASQDSAISTDHIMRAAIGEYRKAGREIVEREFGRYVTLFGD